MKIRFNEDKEIVAAVKEGTYQCAFLINPTSYHNYH